MTDVDNNGLREFPEIRNCRKDEIEELVDYASSIYPYRYKTEKNRIRFKNLARFWFCRTPDTYRYMMLIKEGGRIVGQTYLIPTDYHWEGIRCEAAWSFDLFVDPDKRKSAYGAELMMATRSLPGDSFSTGANDDALPMLRLLGYTHIGNIRKYVGCGAFFGLFRIFYAGRISVRSFPPSVEVRDVIFDRTDDASAIAVQKPFNVGLLEWGRNDDFVSWYYGPHNVNEYAIYRKRGADDYFVVRPIRHAHVTMLALVDFRCPLEKGDDAFRTIVEAVREITHRLHIPFIVSSSTLAVTDRVLESFGFHSVGRPRPVMSTRKWKGMEERIAARDFLQVNFVDSDGEAGWE